jgi:hypothetical protein
MNPVQPPKRIVTLHRRTVRALATRPLLTGLVALEYGLRYAAGSARTSARWALFFAAAGLLSFCAIVGSPRPLHPDDPGALVQREVA